MHHQLRILFLVFRKAQLSMTQKIKVHSVKTRNTQYAHFSRNETAKATKTAEATKTAKATETAEAKPVSAKYKPTDC